MKRTGCAARFGVGAMLRLLLAAGLAAACAVSQPIAPFPDSVVVPPPARVDGALSYEELREAYTTSPNRNPDGLGVFFPVDARSYMTLWSWALERKREEVNRLAYARTDADHETVLRRAQTFHADQVVFQGLLLANGQEFVDARWYLPEGIYLVDDAGRKFMPTQVAESLIRSELRIVLRRSATGGAVDARARAEGFPVIVFPAEAIGERTRAVTLFFAAAGRRFSFTWIFDSAYVPQRQALRPEHGGGMDRLFGTP